MVEIGRVQFGSWLPRRFTAARHQQRTVPPISLAVCELLHINHHSRPGMVVSLELCGYRASGEQPSGANSVASPTRMCRLPSSVHTVVSRQCREAWPEIHWHFTTRSMWLGSGRKRTVSSTANGASGATVPIITSDLEGPLRLSLRLCECLSDIRA